VRCLWAATSSSGGRSSPAVCGYRHGMVLVLALVLLHGTVRIGPTTPVCRAGVPCSKPAAHVVLTFARGASRVRATTDAHGRYHVRLVAGTWTVRANAGLRMTPVRLVVPQAATAVRNFSIDTGIR
jgi:hypothetical protein